MGLASQFQNEKAVRSAVVEILDTKTTEITEKDPRHFNRDLSGTKSFPYPRTYSGFLQTYKSDRHSWMTGGGYATLAAVIALL